MGISGDGVKVLTKGKTQRKSVRQGKRVKVQKSTTKSLALETKAMHSLSLCHHQQQAAGSGMPQSKSRSVGEGATPKRPGAVIDLVKQGSPQPTDGLWMVASVAEKRLICGIARLGPMHGQRKQPEPMYL